MGNEDLPKKWNEFLEKRSIERIAERERNLIKDKVYTELLIDYIKLLKEELKREREGNDFYDENFGGNEGKYTRISPEDWYKRGDATYGGKKAREIISKRKIKSEDL